MRLLAHHVAPRSQINLCSHRYISTTVALWRLPPSQKPPPRAPARGPKPGAGSWKPRPSAAKAKTAQISKTFDHLIPQSRADSIRRGHNPKARLRLDDGAKYSDLRHKLRLAALAQLQLVIDQEPTRFPHLSEVELHRQAALFMDTIDDAFALAERGFTKHDENPLYWSLLDACRKDTKGLRKAVQFHLQSFITQQQFSKDLEESQKRLLDFRFPHEWFPATRMMQRTIHVHVGPTNSGKTYNALKALENSKRGVYAGPLRLLATEVYQRLNAKGMPCALVTGEEVRVPEEVDQYFTSCTVEMMPLNQKFDVAVIDEIQMIADRERGNAWTAAVLGVQAKEVHVCGEDRAVKVIQALCASVGDKCVIHRYERLNPLKTMNQAIDKNYKDLEKGDCIVAFSRLNLHVLKKRVEEKTGRRCAIIYGSLPPEVRVQQAALFNDPNNDYDFIVASDAIGMGLNLEIRRIIMDTVTKYDGSQHRLLTFPEIKQIGGRAGRYRSATDSEGGDSADSKVGYVTTMEKADLKSVQRAFSKKVNDIDKACIHPPAGVVEKFASYYPPNTPLSFILMRIKEAARVSQLFTLDLGADNLEIADIIQDLPLTIHDRLTFCYLPVSLRAESSIAVLRALASVVSTNSTGDLLDIEEIPLEFLDLKLSDFPPGEEQKYLTKLESLHVAINQYVWLSYRYAGMFRSQDLAFHVRSLVEEKLIKTLDEMNFSEEQIERRRKQQRIKANSSKLRKLKKMEEREAEEEEDDEEGDLIRLVGKPSRAKAVAEAK